MRDYLIDYWVEFILMFFLLALIIFLILRIYRIKAIRLMFKENSKRAELVEKKMLSLSSYMDKINEFSTKLRNIKPEVLPLPQLIEIKGFEDLEKVRKNFKKEVIDAYDSVFDDVFRTKLKELKKNFEDPWIDKFNEVQNKIYKNLKESVTSYNEVMISDSCEIISNCLNEVKEFLVENRLEGCMTLFGVLVNLNTGVDLSSICGYSTEINKIVGLISKVRAKEEIFGEDKILYESILNKIEGVVENELNITINEIKNE